MKVCAVLPAFNESETVGIVVEEAKKYVDSVIVVDDGSSDETSKIAIKAGAIVLRHVVNLGVGLATITGNDYAVGKGCDIIVNLDSDGQHSAVSIPGGITFLEKKDLDIVLGSRFLKNTERMPKILKFGNSFLNHIIQLLFNVRISDTQTGFRIMKTETWTRLKIKSDDYSICSEICAGIGKKRLKYGEVPVDTIYLDKFKGTTIFDGARIFFNMIRWRIGI